MPRDAYSQKKTPEREGALRRQNSRSRGEERELATFGGRKRDIKEMGMSGFSFKTLKTG